jgi:hypothetical protein
MAIHTIEQANPMPASPKDNFFVLYLNTKKLSFSMRRKCRRRVKFTAGRLKERRKL